MTQRKKKKPRNAALLLLAVLSFTSLSGCSLLPLFRVLVTRGTRRISNDLANTSFSFPRLVLVEELNEQQHGR